MSLAELNCFKELEHANQRFKRMYADLSLDRDILREVLEKKFGVKSLRRFIATQIVTESGMPVERACQIVNLSPKRYHYKPKKSSEDVLIKKDLLTFAERYPQYGFPMFFNLLRSENFAWNHKRVHRIYKESKLD